MSQDDVFQQDDDLGYPLSDGSSWTVALANQYGRPMRIDNSSREQDWAAVGCEERLGCRYREFLPMHNELPRRLLGVAMLSQSQLVGVIRVVRTIRQKSYTVSDADLIARLADTAGKLAREWISNSCPSLGLFVGRCQAPLSK